MPPRALNGKLLLVIALVLGLGAGFGAALLLRGDDGSGGAEEPVTTAADLGDVDPEATAELPEPDPLLDPAEATDPESALRGFLAAEATGEWEASYEFLPTALRETAYPSAAAWVQAHADFPTVTAYRIDEVAVDEETGRARITTLTGFEPVVDPVRGLVAARGRTEWVVEAEDDGRWYVDASQTANQPLYPDAAPAVDTARSWVDARTACEDTGDLEAGLIGTRALATALCDEPQDEPVAIGEVQVLADSARTAILLSEFGPAVFGWGRTVDVEAATPFTLVLGPLGEEWRVVAVLPAQ